MAAQAGANLITSSVNRPSIFELVASQSLDSTFYPALKKIALVSFVYIHKKLLIKHICSVFRQQTT